VSFLHIEAPKLLKVADSPSIWRPLKGPLKDWPLVLCDAATLHAEHLVPTDHVIKKTDTVEGRVVENCAVHYDAGQRWLYLSNQQPTELILFRQWDSNGALGNMNDK
jgi:hypothetical protein